MKLDFLFDLVKINDCIQSFYLGNGKFNMVTYRIHIFKYN